MVPGLVIDRDQHVRLRVCFAIEMLSHKRFLSSLMRDVASVTIDSTVELLFRLADVLLATPPARNEINCFSRLAFEDLQEAFTFILKFCPVVWLKNLSVASNTGQVLPLDVPHGQLPNGS